MYLGFGLSGRSDLGRTPASSCNGSVAGSAGALLTATSDTAVARSPLLGGGGGARPAAAYDIRHIVKDPDAAATADLLRVAHGGRKRFKHAGSSSDASKARPLKGKAGNDKRVSPNLPLRRQQQEVEELAPVPMVVELEHGEESAGNHDHHLQLQGSLEEDTNVEAASHVSPGKAELPVSSQNQSQVLIADQEEEEVRLDLRLRFELVIRQQSRSSCSGQTSLNAATSSVIGLRL